MTYLIGSGVRARMAARRLRADARAAAGVDHGDAVAPDDEAGVGDVALVARREQLVASLVHENAGRDLLDGERLGRGGGSPRRGIERLWRAARAGGAAGTQRDVESMILSVKTAITGA